MALCGHMRMGHTKGPCRNHVRPGERWCEKHASRHTLTPEQIAAWYVSLVEGRDRYWTERKARQARGEDVGKHPSGWPKGRKRGPRKKPIVWDDRALATEYLERLQAFFTGRLTKEGTMPMKDPKDMDAAELLDVTALDALRHQHRNLSRLERMIDDAPEDKTRLKYIRELDSLAGGIVRNRIRVDEAALRGRKSNDLQKVLEAYEAFQKKLGDGSEAKDITPAADDFP